MYNGYQFVFTAGAPGSAWSMISQRLKESHPDYNNSDSKRGNGRYWRIPDSFKGNVLHEPEKIKEPVYTHMGIYYGPDNEAGHWFDNLASRSVDEFYDECYRPWLKNPEGLSKGGPKLSIKCHWFAYNLEWLWNNCPGHELFLIWRDPAISEEWWYSMGGWDITHPVYTWYENKEKMHHAIKAEADAIWNFVESHPEIQWSNFHDNWWREQFGYQNNVIDDRRSKIFDQIKLAYITIPEQK